MSDSPMRTAAKRRKRFTLKKLINFALSHLCPGGRPREIETRKGRPEVVVELPCFEAAPSADDKP